MFVLKRREDWFGDLAAQLSGEEIGESENHLIIKNARRPWRFVEFTHFLSVLLLNLQMVFPLSPENGNFMFGCCRRGNFYIRSHTNTFLTFFHFFC